MENSDVSDCNLLECLESFNVSGIENDTNAVHPLFSKYKQKFSKSSQIERRKEVLQRQKRCRDEIINQLRTEHSSENDTMEIDSAKRKSKSSRKYKNKLMLSEWLVEVPEELENSWLMLLCPVGKHVLVEAHDGVTRTYAKSGYRLNHGFPSHLPGGYRGRHSENGLTLLDCIYSQELSTYYVLDVICWNGHYVCDSDMEFRTYWLNTKLKEHSNLSVKSKINPFSFVELEKIECSTQSISECLLKESPFPVKLDGLLFYHKQLKYEPGVTPLIGWLKGYMVPEMLGIDVPDYMKAEAPSDYISMAEQLPEEFKRNERRKIELENSMVT